MDSYLLTNLNQYYQQKHWKAFFHKQQECSKSEYCNMVYDTYCNGGDYNTCTGNEMNSTVGSCVWIKQGKI